MMMKIKKTMMTDSSLLVRQELDRILMMIIDDD
jgi:hypothetical protein